MRNPLQKFLGAGSVQTEEIKVVDIRAVEPNPYQPRSDFNDAQIRELAESIKENGLLQPVILRPREEGYQIVAGERRIKALQLIGATQVSAIIKEIEDQDMAQLALVENLQRQDLNFFEEAVGYQRMLFTFNMTQEDLASRLGKGQSTIANKLRLLRLPVAVREQIIQESLSERHARALLRLSSPQFQKEALEEILRHDYSVRQAEELVQRIMQQEKEAEQKKRDKKVLKVFEDMRLYVNTIRNTVKEMKEWGLDIQLEEKEEEEYILFNIKMPKIRKDKE